MKVLINLKMAKDILKRVQKFFEENKFSKDLSGKVVKNTEPLKVEEIKKICDLLEDLNKLYLTNSQSRQYEESFTILNNYKVLLLLAQKNNWTEISSLQFSKSEFDKNANYILEEYTK